MAPYLIQPHVHVCASCDQVVMLDLRRDEYLGFGPQESQALAWRIDGWPVTARDESAKPFQANDSDVSQLLAGMTQRGLITADASVGKPAAPATVPLANDAVLVDPAPHIRLSHIAAFASAWTAATLALRVYSINRAVLRVQKRKARRHDGTPCDRNAMNELVSVFAALRPFLFTAKDECLFDSLALVEFLSRFELFPTWVIGVQAHPFAAHSWVQEGQTVINDFPEHVLKYVPILAV